ncbi:extended synaptotagmin-3, partial [Haematococcus lacustris]
MSTLHNSSNGSGNSPSLSVPVSVDLTTPAGAALAEALPVAFLWVAQAGALWVSQLMLQLWPYIARAVEEAVKAKVPKALEARRPSWMEAINLKTFSMGSHPPIVRSVHVQPVSAENLNKVRLVVGVEWSSSLDVQLEIKPLPAKLPLLPEALNQAVKDLAATQ